MVRELALAGRYDFVVTSQPNIQLLQNLFLSNGFHPRIQTLGSWPFYLVPAIIEHPRYAYGALRVNIKEAARRFRETDAPDWEAKSREQYEFVNQCYGLSLKIAALVLDELSPSSKTFQFDDLIEECRALWGNRTSILISAFDVLGSKRTAVSSAPFDFFDATISFTKKMRGAKARRNDQRWWEAQLSNMTVNGASSTNRQLLLMSCFTFCQSNMILACEKLLSPVFEALSRDEWVSVSEMVIPMRQQAVNAKASAHMADTSDSIRSSRLAYLLAMKFPKLFGTQAFLNHFLDSEDKTARSLEFRQRWALEAALVGKLEWSTALDIVRQTYALGASSLDFYLDHQNRRLPVEVASIILATPFEFPLALWDTAEGVASSIARRAVRAVGSVAKSERWFST
jgi:hypothetical protein